ncbi:hypothetical protein [uncultured Algimonas sp.]|uniref:hypothetical protein n=1 Tax=uncultured Algimonas sp. TaxID=1547920 RepID=UPI00260B7BE2|nr:hypothetical protein [uncultured Algimonas sp.]
MTGIVPAPYSTDYEITDAMFGAFRAPGGMRLFWILAGWGTLFLTITSLPLIPSMIGSYVELIVATANLETDADAASAVFGTMGRFFAYFTLWFIVYVGVVALVRAAFFRNYFFSDPVNAFPIRFGGDEGRQALAILGFSAALMFAYFIALIICGMVFGAFVAAAGGESVVLFAFGMMLTYGLIMWVSAWIGLRLYAAGALTALRRRIHVFAARHVSRNRFWAMFGSILVAGLIGNVVSYTTFSIGMLMAFSELGLADIFALLSSADSAASLAAIERASETAGFRITSIVAIVLTSFGYMVFTLMLAGPQAFFTKQWAEAANATDREETQS